MIVSKEDGGYSLYWSKDHTQASVAKDDFVGIYCEFYVDIEHAWICSKHSDSGLLGYVVGFNIDKGDAVLEITLKSARGNIRIFKTIDAAFKFLLSCGYNHAVINYG